VQVVLTLKLDKKKKESPVLSIHMCGSEVLESVRRRNSKKKKKGGKIAKYPSSMSILSERCRPPRPPSPPKVTLTEEELLPPTPSVHIENKKEAFSPALQEFCLRHPIAVSATSNSRMTALCMRSGGLNFPVLRMNFVVFFLMK
jgi:hypothetical protein